MPPSTDPAGRAPALPGAAPPSPPPIGAQLEAAVAAPPIGRVVRTSLLVMALTLTPFFGWATMTTLERAVIAPGQLIPESRRKTVNLLEPGILRRLLVREGEAVEAGQPLLQLDVTQAEALAEQARAQVWSGRARIARLRAEQAESRDLAFPEELRRAGTADPAVRVFLEAEEALFAARWQAFDGQVAVQERQIAQFQEQIAGARAQRQAAERQLRSAREQVASLQELLKQGFAARFRVLEMQRVEQGYIAAAGQAAAQEAQFREAVAGAEKQLATLRLARLSEIAADLQAAETQVATAAQQLRAAEDVLARREVLAPEAGRVTAIRAFTPGSSIASGEAILDLVPLRDRFVVEAQISPTDIEQVAVGQRVNVRLVPFRVRHVPLIPGRIIHVAPDAAADPAGRSYYLARAELDPEVLDRVPEVVLHAGMPAEVFVLGEERTPLSYLWSPIRNASRRAFRD
ncbi:HlyD family type I secretion periplasmic adaptor subunit [Crenalkalicoccus roseus]|uniref:HlyD family type I secretion periplasmic adaptor subunit n=1 Tax=Crenalkalicoccus roseus TaxID=1485588 RepID=UPI0010806FAB|nr:HlyD family type I secretion periplasmic adaptor subunit [Crenalkalicoccus roseus]